MRTSSSSWVRRPTCASVASVALEDERRRQGDVTEIVDSNEIHEPLGAQGFPPGISFPLLHSQS